MLKVTDATVRYGSLKRFTRFLQYEQGEIVTLLGQWRGKSTTLRMLSGLHARRAVSIFFEDLTSPT